MTGRIRSTKSNLDFAIDAKDALLAFAPSSYWRISGSSPHSPTNEFIRRVTSAAESGDWIKVKAPPGSFGMRGGDFLPGFRSFEVEIARLALESTTWDVISIRARPSSRGILYRAVNEYASEFIIRPMSSKKPLSLAGLIKLIDGMKNGDILSSPAALRASQGPFDTEKAIRDVEAFVTVASDFYPDLEAWYDQDANAWVQAELEELPRRLLNDQVARDAECARLADDASKDDAVALMKLGYRHFIGNGVKRSRTKAVELWRRAADLGEPTAMLNLAVCLQDGMGCKRDRKSALVLYEKLAEQDYYVGLSMAAYCRYVGIGCRANKVLALQCNRPNQDVIDPRARYRISWERARTSSSTRAA